MAGLIVSVQGYSKQTTKELSEIAINSGAHFIRTDKDIKNKSKTIGLKKDLSQTFYITPTIADIKEVSKWAERVAIDCRYENPNLITLLEYAESNKITVICDVESEDDLDNLLKIGYPVEFIATTFCYNKLDKLEELKNIITKAKTYNITVIAEGGYNEKLEIETAADLGADYICIGEAISKISELTLKYYNYCKPIKGQKSIVIDIDDTLLLYPGKPKNYLRAAPNIEEIKLCNQYKAGGYKIIIYTARNSSKFRFTEAQLNHFGVEYDQLIMDKPTGDYYIDRDSYKSLKDIKL